MKSPSDKKEANLWTSVIIRNENELCSWKSLLRWQCSNQTATFWAKTTAVPMVLYDDMRLAETAATSPVCKRGQYWVSWIGKEPVQPSPYKQIYNHVFELPVLVPQVSCGEWNERELELSTQRVKLIHIFYCVWLHLMQNWIGLSTNVYHAPSKFVAGTRLEFDLEPNKQVQPKRNINNII